MNCEFCGSNVLTGAKLCAACRAALKRARNEPLSVLQPLVKRASETLERRKARNSKSRRAKDKLGAVIPPPIADSRRSATPALVGALAVVACVVGYVALQRGDHGARAVAADDLPKSTLATAIPGPETPERVKLALLSPIVAPPGVEFETLPNPSTMVKTARPARVQVPELLALPIEPAEIAQPLPTPIAMIVPVPADRKSQVRDAFAKCTSDSVFERAYCEERARIQYCDGLWGTVSQCPPQRDSGR